MNPTRPTLHPAEREVLHLESATESLDNLLNHELLQLIGSPDATTVLFHSSVHMKLFNVLLIDFLSRAGSELLDGTCGTLADLDSLAKAPLLDPGSSPSLAGPVAALRNWLSSSTPVSGYLPSADVEFSTSIPRQTYIYMCGNISKHNFVRLDRITAMLRTLFKSDGVQLDEDDARIALDDFFDCFHRHLLNLHASELVQLLNDVRWGVQDYLRSTYHCALVDGTRSAPGYKYLFPESIQRPVARHWFWSLMNRVRSQPLLHRFRADPSKAGI